MRIFQRTWDPKILELYWGLPTNFIESFPGTLRKAQLSQGIFHIKIDYCTNFVRHCFNNIPTIRTFSLKFLTLSVSKFYFNIFNFFELENKIRSRSFFKNPIERRAYTEFLNFFVNFHASLSKTISVIPLHQPPCTWTAISCAGAEWIFMANSKFTFSCWMLISHINRCCWLL